MGPGVVSFYWKVSSEQGHDKLEFLTWSEADGFGQGDEVSGETDWHQMAYTLTGAHEYSLWWTYRKDSSGTAGSDCGWVDKIEWSPGLPATYGASGTVSGAVGAGVRITFTRVSDIGAIPAPATTDGSGGWAQTGFAAGSTYRAVATKEGYSFTPAYRDFGAASTSQNFTASTGGGVTLGEARRQHDTDLLVGRRGRLRRLVWSRRPHPTTEATRRRAVPFQTASTPTSGHP